MRLARRLVFVSLVALLSLGSQCPTGMLLTGFVPEAGTARDVIVDAASGLAYVASDEFGLSVVRVSDRSRPVALGAPLWSFPGTRLAKSGSLVAVASRTGGLHIVDVIDPVSPSTRGSLEGIIAEGVALYGSYAYVRIEVAGNPSHIDLGVVDVSAPGRPVLVNQIVLPAGDEVEIVGTYAYVTTGTELRIFDLANPRAPSARGALAISGGARDLAVSGRYAYVGNSTSLQVVDVGNPSAPVLIGSLSGGATALEVDGSRLYCVSGEYLRVIDVSNPRAPRLLGSGPSYGSWGVDVTGGYAYLASPRVDLAAGTGGLYITDVAQPAAHSLLGRSYAGAGNTGVAAAGTIAVTSTRETGLHVVDMSDPGFPERVGQLAGVAAVGVALSTSHAFVRVEVPGNPSHVDLAVVDVRNPARPTIVSQTFLAGTDTVELAGSLVYVTTGTELRIFDASNPASLRSVASLALAGGARELALTGRYAIVGNTTSVHVVDVVDPTRPRLVGTLSGGTTALAAAGNRFFAVSGGMVRVVGIDDPALPTVLSTGNSHNAADLDASAGRLLLASPSEGLAVYSVANTGALTFSSLHDLPGAARSVDDSGGAVFVGDTAATVAALR